MLARLCNVPGTPHKVVPVHNRNCHLTHRHLKIKKAFVNKMEIPIEEFEEYPSIKETLEKQVPTTAPRSKEPRIVPLVRQTFIARKYFPGTCLKCVYNEGSHTKECPRSVQTL